MNLFLDDVTPRIMEKISAAFARLSENPDDWQSEITDELYRQVPFIGDFDTKIIMMELDPERRYALAAIKLSSRLNKIPKQENGHNPYSNEISPDLSGQKTAIIPVIVQEGKMSPLDVFISNGMFQPLTDKRLKKEMFRPQMFEAIGESPGTKDMTEMLYPPYRMGLGGTNSYMGHMQKSSSPNRIIDVIRHTLNQNEVEKVCSAITEDEETLSLFIRNPEASHFMDKLVEDVKTVSSSEMMKTASGMIKPKVIQISKIDGGFRVKTANPEALLPEENDIPRPLAEEMAGADVVRKVENGETVTISTNKASRESLADITVSVVEEFGEYKVKTKDGRELVGWVFPHVVDLDGTSLDISVFTNGSESAVQESIAGSLVGKGTNLIDENPSGFGIFYLARQGGATAIVPVNIVAEAQSTELVDEYICETMLGERVIIKKLPGLVKAAQIEDGMYAIPDDCGWIPLQRMTELSENPDEFMKTSAVRLDFDAVKVMHDHGSYSMKGRHIEKLASVCQTSGISEDQAIFNLAILGIPSDISREKLAESRKYSHWVNIQGAKPVKLLSERIKEARMKSIEFVKKVPRMPMFLKEAALIDDPSTVDNVLSLGFLNSENVSTFVEYIPDLERTVSRMCNLLIASRLGLKNIIDVTALERLIKHMDVVINGLKELSQYTND